MRPHGMAYGSKPASVCRACPACRPKTKRIAMALVKGEAEHYESESRYTGEEGFLLPSGTTSSSILWCSTSCWPRTRDGFERSSHARRRGPANAVMILTAKDTDGDSVGGLDGCGTTEYARPTVCVP